jgi:hypothetical protein
MNTVSQLRATIGSSELNETLHPARREMCRLRKGDRYRTEGGGSMTTGRGRRDECEWWSGWRWRVREVHKPAVYKSQTFHTKNARQIPPAILYLVQRTVSQQLSLNRWVQACLSLWIAALRHVRLITGTEISFCHFTLMDSEVCFASLSVTVRPSVRLSVRTPPCGDDLSVKFAARIFCT